MTSILVRQEYKQCFLYVLAKGFSDRVDDLRAICIVNDQEYLDGDVFYVKEDPDLYCVCLPGYGGNDKMIIPSN